MQTHLASNAVLCPLRIVILFSVLGPYVIARVRAASVLSTLTVIEGSIRSSTYAWSPHDQIDGLNIKIISSDKSIEELIGGVIAKRVFTVLDEIAPDVVAIPGYSTALALAAIYWCGINSVPAIMMSDSTAHDEPRNFWKESIKRRILRMTSAGLVGGAPHTDYLRDLGLPKNHIFTGYDVIDNAYFAAQAEIARQDKESLREHLALPQKFFLASNRFIEKKNLPRLLDAYAWYRNQAGLDAWSLVMLGDGLLKPSLLEIIERYDLGQWVLFPGFKQYDEIPLYYGLAGAFVHASTTEQWGLVINEAMASGLPVLVSDRCGCAPDLVEEGRNGYTFDPYDVDALAGLMLKISSDDCDRVAMGQASREIIARWTPQTFAENLVKAAEAALQAPRPKLGLRDKTLLWALMRR